MSYSTTSRAGKRFIGNNSSSKKEVHDQNKEDTNANGCQIDEILRAGHGEGFTPDTLSQAHSEGYDNCAKCIGNSTQ